MSLVDPPPGSRSSIRLTFGESGKTEFCWPSSVLAAVHVAPASLTDVRGTVQKSLGEPIDSPPLKFSFVPGDCVAIPIDPLTPQIDDVLGPVLDLVQAAGVSGENISVLIPATSVSAVTPLLRILDQPAYRAVQKVVHDAENARRCGYLSSTSTGQRVYLAREIIDADVVLLVGTISFDSVLGYRGAASALYPAFSNEEARRKSQGVGHEELSPEDHHPLRQLVDEISWLCGLQFVIQVIPGAQGGVAEVLCGQPEGVIRRGCVLLDQLWKFELPRRVPFVVLGLDALPGQQGWDQLATALQMARQVVSKDGTIVVLSELDAEWPAGIEVIKSSHSPKEALEQLRKLPRHSSLAAMQIARTLDWANVYLHSRVLDENVEDLFMTPLANPGEVSRLAESAEAIAVLGSAQNVYARIESDDLVSTAKSPRKRR